MNMIKASIQTQAIYKRQSWSLLFYSYAYDSGLQHDSIRIFSYKAYAVSVP